MSKEKIINYYDNISKYSYGGKANSLLKLVKYGLPVPKFMILSSNFFKEFINYNKIETHDFEKVCEQIDQGVFSESLINELFDFWNKNKFEKVAVRSSAANEDGKEKSFAGQYNTYLYVTKDNLLEAIKNCWKSLYQENVRDYQNDNKFSYDMNVIVQEMIDAEYAGVAFSTDNMHSTKYYSLVEACEGVGEKLVSGEVTPTKYFLRKENNNVDFVIGKNYPIEKELNILSVLINKIEKSYGMVMDIEWAIYENNVYILQARPVTSFPSFKIPFALAISRPRPLVGIQCAEICEREGLREILGGLYYFTTLYYYRNNTFEEYNNMLDIEQIPSVMVNYVMNHKQEMLELLEKGNEECRKLEQEVIINQKFDIRRIIDSFKKFIPFNLISNFVEKTTIITDFDVDINDEFVQTIIKNREYYDDIKYKIDNIIIEKIKATIPKQLLPYYNLLTIEEAFEGKKVTEQDLIQRKKGFVYYMEHLVLENEIDSFFEKENIFLKNDLNDIDTDDSKIIKGSAVYPGKSRGHVKLVFCDEDIAKIKKGDIIVSPMTVPTFISGMRKANAIITDEGGVVCHAALIAREMKKVCVIGTKNATKILKDNMIVEVDGDLGIVKILED